MVTACHTQILRATSSIFLFSCKTSGDIDQVQDQTSKKKFPLQENWTVQ